MTLWHSFRKGWTLSLRAWPLVAVFYLLELLASVALTAPQLGGLAATFGHSTAAAGLLGPLSLGLLLDLGRTSSQPIGAGAALSLALAAVLLLLLAAVLRGGAMDLLAHAEGRFGWRGFLGGSRRFGWRFLKLLLFLVPGGLVVLIAVVLAGLVIGLVAAGRAPETAPLWVGGGLALVAFLSLSLLTASLDYARASLVLDPSAGLPRHMGRALRFLFGRFPRAFGLVLLFALASLSVYAVLFVAHRYTPLGGAAWAGLVAKQVGALATWWVRVAAWGGMITLFRSQ